MLQQLWHIAKLGFWLGSTVFGGVSAADPIIRDQAPHLGPEKVDGLYAKSVCLPGPSFMNLWGRGMRPRCRFPRALAGQVALPLRAYLPFVGEAPQFRQPTTRDKRRLRSSSRKEERRASRMSA